MKINYNIRNNATSALGILYGSLILVKLDFGVMVFVEGGKQSTKEYFGVMREPTTNATHIWQQARIEPGSHWWEVSTLTTAPSLLLKKCD